MSIIELETPWCFNAMSLEQHEVEKLQKYFVDEGNHQCDWQNSEYCGITSDGLSEYFRSSEHFDENEDSDNVTVYTIEQLRDIIAEHLAKQPVEKLEDGIVYHSEHSKLNYLFVNEKEWINLSSKMFYEGGISWDDMHQSSTHVITKATPEQIAHYEACVKAGKYVEPESVTQFVVGKWYKYNRHIGKFSGYVDGLFRVSEYIYKNKHYAEPAKWGSKLVDNEREPIEDLSEIQDLLPDGHPDKQAKVYLDDKGRPLKEFKVGSWYTNPKLTQRTLLNGNPARFFKVSSCVRKGSSRDYYYNQFEFDEVADKYWNKEIASIGQANTDLDQEMVEVFPVVKSERYLATMKFFEQLREPERSGAIANYDEGYDSDVPESLSDALIIGFRWGDSNQTYSYWDRIKNSVDDKTYFKEELLVFGKYKVGDIVVSLALKEMFKVSDKSKEDLLVMEQGTYTDSSLIRPATPEEVEAYNQGVRNIANIKPKDYKEAVHCTTQEEWDFVFSKYKFCGESSNWKQHGKDTYIDLHHGSFGDVNGTGKSWGYTILTFKQWCEKYGHSYEEFTKQKEKLKMEELLSEVKTKFPIGTKFKCLVSNSIVHEVEDLSLFKIYSDTIFYKNQLVYGGTKWAEIIKEEPWVAQVGDWVVITNGEQHGSDLKTGAIVQCTESDDNSQQFGKELSTWTYPKHYRKATQEEIDSVTKPEKKDSIFEQLRESMFDSDMAWYKLHSTIEKHKQQDELVIYKPKQTRLVEPGAVSANVSTTNLIIKSNSKYL